jgi:hypothetical protein
MSNIFEFKVKNVLDWNHYRKEKLGVADRNFHVSALAIWLKAYCAGIRGEGTNSLTSTTFNFYLAVALQSKTG